MTAPESSAIARAIGAVCCWLGLHRWQQVPFRWSDPNTGVKLVAYGNPECRRCGMVQL